MRFLILDPRPAAFDILARIERLQALLAAGEPRLEPNSMDRDVVERCLEVISEASRRLPTSFKSAHPEIAWRGVADLGNVLRHNYDRVSRDELLRILRNDLAPLKSAILSFLAELEP